MGNCFSSLSSTDSSGSDVDRRRRQERRGRGDGTGHESVVRPADLPSGSKIPFNPDPRSSQRYTSADKGKGKALPRRSKSARGRASGGDLIEMSANPPSSILRQYATLPSPSTALSARVLLSSTPSAIAIFDAYPKAKYHFLVMPRYPFPPQSSPDSGKSIVQLHHLDDLRCLLTKPSRKAREEIVNALADAAREVEEMIRDEMVKTEGVEWKIDVGFHAIPSIKHVHLHVISEDRISTCLKTKKHYNSFRPDLGFFISIMDVQRWIQEDDASIKERVNALLGSASLLASPLTCFKCDEPFSSIPKLKAHMEREFEEEKKQGLENIRRSGRQRSSDEDMF